MVTLIERSEVSESCGCAMNWLQDTVKGLVVEQRILNSPLSLTLTLEEEANELLKRNGNEIKNQGKLTKVYHIVLRWFLHENNNYYY